MANCAEATSQPAGQPEDAPSPLSRGKSVRKTLIRRPSRKADGNVPEQGLGERGKSKKVKALLSRAKSKKTTENDEKFARSKTGVKTLSTKEQVLLKFPGLALEQYSENECSRNLVLTGTNSLKAELLDMVTMATIMSENKTCLTRAAVERFFEWIPLFGVYMERYFFVEEDVLLAPLSKEFGQFKGNMKPSTRMALKGTLQKECKDILNLQETFLPSLPVGERIGKVVEAVDQFAKGLLVYIENVLDEVPKRLNQVYSKTQIEKLRGKLVKYVVNHVGTEDFLVLYTRWMKSRTLIEWKTKVLLPTDFKFFAYSSWEKDMDYAHFAIVAEFAETLEYENKQDEDSMNESQHAEFVKYKMARELQMAKQRRDSNDSCDEEYESEGDDGFEVQCTQEEILRP